MVACLLIVINCVVMGLDIPSEEKTFPQPTVQGSFEGSIRLNPSKCSYCSYSAFASIMFAYAGASTFPTIQADMRDRGKFIYAAVLAILSIELSHLKNI